LPVALRALRRVVPCWVLMRCAYGNSRRTSTLAGGMLFGARGALPHPAKGEWAGVRRGLAVPRGRGRLRNGVPRGACPLAAGGRAGRDAGRRKPVPVSCSAGRGAPPPAPLPKGMIPFGIPMAAEASACKAEPKNPPQSLALGGTGKGLGRLQIFFSHRPAARRWGRAGRRRVRA